MTEAPGFAAAVLLAAIGVGAYFGITHYTKSKPFTLHGTLTLHGATSVIPGTGCQGKGGYQDIGPGAAVTVTDESGSLLAKGKLERGSEYPEFCVMGFDVDGVPAGKKFYKVEVSHRGQMSYTEAEARRRVDLQLGEPASTPNPTTTSSKPPLVVPTSTTPQSPTISTNVHEIAVTISMYRFSVNCPAAAARATTSSRA
jgi:hypothetical protein